MAKRRLHEGTLDEPLTAGQLARVLSAMEPNTPVYIVYGQNTREVVAAKLTPDWYHALSPGIELHAGGRQG